MKKITTLFTVFALFYNCAKAQDASVKTLQATAGTTVKTEGGTLTKSGWKRGGSFGLNLTQVSNSNWVAAGGDKFSLSTAAALNVFASKKWGRHSWDNMVDVNYALVKTTTLGLRKVNDRLDVISKYGYQPGKWKNVNLSALGQLRSQITSGYDYDYFGTGAKRRNSGFFAPAYVTIAPGIDWKPKEWLSVFFSPLSGRFTIVTNDPYSYVSPDGIYNGNPESPLATLYGVDPAKKYKGEFGAFMTTTLKKDIMKNINYYSKLDLYSNYLNNPQNIDVFWTNQIKMKVNKWIQVSYTLDLLYDDDVKTATKVPTTLGLQALSTLGVGFAAKF